MPYACATAHDSASRDSYSLTPRGTASTWSIEARQMAQTAENGQMLTNFSQTKRSMPPSSNAGTTTFMLPACSSAARNRATVLASGPGPEPRSPKTMVGGAFRSRITPGSHISERMSVMPPRTDSGPRPSTRVRQHCGGRPSSRPDEAFDDGHDLLKVVALNADDHDVEGFGSGCGTTEQVLAEEHAHWLHAEAACGLEHPQPVGEDRCGMRSVA
eukprot:scaffold249338_cov36-Tisochrysis_lutea.AAC.1